MPVYTHNTRDNGAPCTFVKMIVSDATAAQLGLNDDWFEVSAEEVSDIEELTGMDYPLAENLTQIDMQRTAEGTPFRRYGRL